MYVEKNTPHVKSLSSTICMRMQSICQTHTIRMRQRTWYRIKTELFIKVEYSEFKAPNIETAQQHPTVNHLQDF